MVDPLRKPSDKADRPESAPDSVSRSVVREGAQAAARNIVKRGAHAAAPAPQASLTVLRQPSLRVAVKCGVCVVALLGIVVLATTFVARLASIRILPATQFAEDLIRGSLTMEDEFVESEQRFVSIGMNAFGRLMVVIYAYRGDDVRLISVRNPEPKERRAYEKGI